MKAHNWVIIALVMCMMTDNSKSCQVKAPKLADPSVIPDYYWKDYIGVIPPDAIEGGTDQSGNPTYVGQAYIPDKELQPVTIFRGCRTAKGTAKGKVFNVNRNIKILCAEDKSKFEWVPTKSDAIHMLTNRHKVLGGYANGHKLHIGRVNHHDRLITGKVKKELAIAYRDKRVKFDTYEVLTYKMEKEFDETVLDIDIDVRSL